MLRILVISLFVVNLLLFGFWDNEPEVKQKTTATSVSAQDSNVPTIHLFSEMMENQGLLSDNRQCFSLGPFHSIDDLDDVYASLAEVSVTLSERQTQALVEKGYWAYLPPYSSLLEANEVLLSLQALGMKDVAVIYNGEWTKAISLGYFLRQENAVRRKKSLEDRGYAPLIRVQRQAEDRYWLDYEQAPGSDLITLDMQGRANDFMQRSMPCPEREIIEAPVTQAVEQVATAVRTPDPEPVDVAEEASEIVEQRQQEDPRQDDTQSEETDNTTVDDPEQRSEEVVTVQPEDADPQTIDTDNTPSEELEQQAEEVGDSILQEEEPVQELAEGMMPGAIDTAAEQIEDTSSNEVDEQSPDAADPISEDEIEEVQLDNSAELPVTQDDGTGSEIEAETEPEPTEDSDPYDGDEIEIVVGQN